ncbi:cytochrome P450 [Nonomuraea sp. NPDC023979]|uniref:cytochrome P450 n=1 Tax=Nonomuraea sp. NPDC023979 TaxID=3154796 RepID=UPI0033DB7A3D
MRTITRPPRANAAETLRLGLTLVLPALAQGVIVRRPLMVRLAALTRADDRAVRLLARLRARHGDGPLLVRVPLRGWAVLVLSAADVRRVLDDRSLTPANREKRGALGHFQPDGVLITPEPELRERRHDYNERVLLPDFGPVARAAAEEAATLPYRGVLTWTDFHAAFWRLARRVVLGDGARDDVTLTRMLDRLRGDANWFYLRGRRTDVYRAFRRRLDGHLARAEPGSLAAALAATPAPADVCPEGQVPHWLFAFDAAAIAAYRALALLATHPPPRTAHHPGPPSTPAHPAPPGTPGEGTAARDGAAADGAATHPGPSGVDGAGVRAAVLESVRLWPTTLAILRDTTGPTEWGVPEGSLVAIYSPYVNRAEAGDHYRPGLWTGDDAWDDGEPLDGGGAWAGGDARTGVPFSAGFARCAGRDLVLFTASSLLGAFLREREVFASVRLEGALPASFDHTGLRFAVRQGDL